jgi:hypothetical protein
MVFARNIGVQVRSSLCQDCDSLSKEAGSDSNGGTVLDISDAGTREICSREENVLFAQKMNPKLSKHYNNVSLETIQEESVCPPNSHCCMLNCIECSYQQRPCYMNRSYKPDMPKSFHVHHASEKKSHTLLSSDVLKQAPYGVSTESMLSQRIRFMWKKMDAAFDDILSLYNKIPEPDGSQDLLRRCKRAAEFSSRFSRNYLYQLQQQVCILCS